jgi:hypothetical protein
MGKIKIRKIEQSVCDLYDPEGKLIGVIDNELSLCDVRVQIAKAKASGYYIIWKVKRSNVWLDIRLDITPDGRLSEWPVGFMDKQDFFLEDLLEAQFPEPVEK